MFESYYTILPIFFSLLLTLSLLIILIPNPIHAVLLLILLFCNTALLLLSFNIEFLALMLIIIYVGAIAILFLFVLMMLDIKTIGHQSNDFYNYIFFSSFLVLAFFFETFLSTFDFLNYNSIQTFTLQYTNWIFLVDPLFDIETIGQILYTFYFLFFLIAGIILLIALIGAVMLTHEGQRVNSIQMTTFKQVSRLKNNAVFNIK